MQNEIPLEIMVFRALTREWFGLCACVGGCPLLRVPQISNMGTHAIDMVIDIIGMDTHVNWHLHPSL